MKEIQLQKTAKLKKIVTDDMLAVQVGSGDVKVLATPMMVALMEECAVACIKEYMEDGETTVGIHIDTTHDAATPSGMEVCVTATVEAVDGKKISFKIIAQDEKDTIGIAKHERVLVKKEKFEQRAEAKRQ